MSVFRKRIVAAVLAGVMIAAAILIGRASGPVAQTDAFYVADYANVLSKQTEDYIAAQSYAIGGATGARVFVVTVESTGVKSIEKYFNSLVSAWNLDGYSDVMLLLDIGGDDYWFTYGSDWWDVFDYTYGDMLDMYLKPDFATRRYEDGVLKFFDAVCGELVSGISMGSVDYNPPVVTQAYAAYPAKNLMTVFVLIFILLVILAIISGGRRRTRYYGYGGYYGPSWPYRRYRPFRPYHHHHRPAHPPRRHAPPPRRPAPPSRGLSTGGSFFGGSRSGGSGSSFGGFSGGGRSGSGRSGGGFSGGGRSGSGRSGGGFSGGGRSGSGRSGGGFSGGGRSGGGRSGGGGGRKR